MRLICSVILLIALATAAEAGERFSKAKGRGAWAFAVAKSNCSATPNSCPCGDSCPCGTPLGTPGPAGSCAAGQCATKPLPQALPEAPVQSGTVVYSSGSCSSGSCGGTQSYSRGIFGRRR